MKLPLLLLLLSSAARAQETPAVCPTGTHRVSTADPLHPFDCVKDGKKEFGSVAGPAGFKTRPRCPRGTRAALSNDGLQQYRCVRVLAGETDPELAPMESEENEAPPLEEGQADSDPLTRGCPPGKRKVRTTDPLNPYQCVAQSSRIRVISEDAYRKYAVPREMSFDYPRMLLPRDGWKEDVPMLSFTLDDGSPGKPVTITITKVEPSQPTFVDMAAAIAKDKDWQGAKDGGMVPVAGTKARVLFVSGESKTAYIPLGDDAYYSVVYSAPVEAYDVYLSAFNRLLKSLRISRRGK